MSAPDTEWIGVQLRLAWRDRQAEMVGAYVSSRPGQDTP